MVAAGQCSSVWWNWLGESVMTSSLLTSFVLMMTSITFSSGEDPYASMSDEAVVNYLRLLGKVIMQGKEQKLKWLTLQYSSEL